jgi:hypothetical protein
MVREDCPPSPACFFCVALCWMIRAECHYPLNDQTAISPIPAITFQDHHCRFDTLSGPGIRRPTGWASRVFW